MPFNSIDAFKSVDAYKKELKKELSRLDNTLGDFFFYDEYPVNGSKEPVLVVGEVKPPILKTLKSGAKAYALGKCFIEGSTLKLTLTKGKMPEVKLKPVFKGIPFDFKMVSSGPVTDDASDNTVDDTVDDTVDESAARDESKAKKRLKATTARFDKVKGHLADDERIALRNMFGEVIEIMKASDWTTSFKTLETLDAKMIGFVRAKKEASQESADTRTSETAAAAKLLDNQIKSDLAELGGLEKKVTREADLLADLQKTLRGQIKKSAIPKQEAKIVTCEERLAEYRQNLADSRGSLLKSVKILKAAKLEKEKSIVTALGTIQSRIKALDSMLDDVPIEQARSAIEETIRKMAEATEWREEQFKKEAGGGEGHGTARHGAQTGLDRQARRAATQDGVTPEQTDNPTGVSQTIEWNKVKITYTEEDGKRVVADREKVAQTLATEISNTQFSGGVGSSWANPVLEKEAVDKALAVGRKLAGYTHYTTGNTSSTGMVATNFTNLTVVLDEPTSGPGWGYAVTRKGTAVDPVVATAVLKKFEKGDMTLNKLFSDLNVELIEKPNKGGVLMVPRCKVILTRATETDDWKLKTHYPDHKLEAKHEGWEAERGQPKGDVTLRKGDVLKVFDNKVLP